MRSAHPKAISAASQDQKFKTEFQRDTTMTKLYSLAAAFALFAPLAVAALVQAAQILA